MSKEKRSPPWALPNKWEAEEELEDFEDLVDSDVEVDSEDDTLE